MIDWQATEILAGCLFTALFLALVLVVAQCLASCFENWRTARRKVEAERLPDDYVDEIKRLLDRHKKIMNEYDFPDDARTEVETLKADSIHPITESELGSPMRARANSSAVKLQRLKEELDEYRIEPGPSLQAQEQCEAKRRSWGGLNDSVFDPVELPSSLDASVQTTPKCSALKTSAWAVPLKNGHLCQDILIKDHRVNIRRTDIHICNIEASTAGRTADFSENANNDVKNVIIQEIGSLQAPMPYQKPRK